MNKRGQQEHFCPEQEELLYLPACRGRLPREFAVLAAAPSFLRPCEIGDSLHISPRRTRESIYLAKLTAPGLQAIALSLMWLRAVRTNSRSSAFVSNKRCGTKKRRALRKKDPVATAREELSNRCPLGDFSNVTNRIIQCLIGELNGEWENQRQAAFSESASI
jgi:hypothetical protein